MARTRGSWNSPSIWVAGAAAAAVATLTGYLMFSGDDSASSTPAKGGTGSSVSSPAGPPPSYAAPSDWTEPERWVALPRGQRTDAGGSEVGFPHTVEGAVAMLKAANTTVIEGDRSNVDEQLRIYRSYVGKADQSAGNAKQIEKNAEQTDRVLRRRAGVLPGEPLPSGAYVRSYVVGYKVIKASPDEVSVWVLARVTQKTGELDNESSSFTRTLAGAQWQDGDWKMTGAAIRNARHATQGKAKPEMAAVGDAAFNDAAWTAIREAS
ncbi:hypothetical protein [Streptomyces lavendofoliae]|uniref:hypothetical protein n=1 Tax=Streptomyces lavendofoliae TaxID=67314 RepID=UPI003D8DAB44